VGVAKLYKDKVKNCDSPFARTPIPGQLGDMTEARKAGRVHPMILAGAAVAWFDEENSK